MAWFKRKSPELRSGGSVTVSTSQDSFLSLVGWGETSGDIQVNSHTAMQVPAIWAAVNFIASTFAGLPLHIYRRTDNGRERVTDRLSEILHHAPNDAMSSFAWRKHMLDTVLNQGRHVSFIERNSRGTIVNIWPLDPDRTVIKREAGHLKYELKEGAKTHVYEASEVIDMAFMMRPDMTGHRSPIMSNRDTIALAIALTKYACRFFDNGGVPPFALVGNFESPGALSRAQEDVDRAIKEASKQKRQTLALPGGHELKALGIDPEKMQMTEARRFVVEEIARIYSLPPIFLQDLTHGTFSNTEQQDLHFVKHTLKRWCEQFEQEINLKLFGRSSRRKYVELNMDGLLRGDFKTRMEANARAIQTGQMTPNEAREKDNRPHLPGGDDLFMQGATVPIGSTPQTEGTTDD